MLTISNAVKAQIIAAINAALGILDAFKIGHLTPDQKSAVMVGTNAVLALVVGVTYKQSAKRVPDPVVAPVADPPSGASPAA